MSFEAALERDVGASVDVTDGFGGDGGEEDAVRRTEGRGSRGGWRPRRGLARCPPGTAGHAEPAKAARGPLGGGGFKLKLPTPGKASPAGLGAAVKAAPAPARKLVEQRRMDEIASTFTCPLEDVIAFAEMIGMDPQEDLDLLWIADEALQAPEPVGWEQRLDPRGNTYYCNT